MNYLSWILNRSLIFKFQDFMYRSVKLYFFHQFIVLNNEQILCSKTSVILLTLPSTIWYVNYCVILNSIATCKAILLVMYLPALLKNKSGSFSSIVVLLEIYIHLVMARNKIWKEKKENFVLKFGEKLSCAWKDRYFVDCLILPLAEFFKWMRSFLFCLYIIM